MLNRDSRGEDTELLPLPRQNQKVDRLIYDGPDHDVSEEERSEIGSEQQPLEHEAQSKQSVPHRRAKAHFEDWKFTVFLALVSSLIVLCFNVGLLLFAATQPHQGNNRVLYEGDAEKVDRLSTGFHLVINILSTVLLSASNFGMQCLNAPTRQNIDQAHQQGRWLDIGVPSIRNLFRVSMKRSLLWLLLSFSSLPFHMVYNSAIYPTQGAAVYNVFAGSGPLDQEAWSDVHLKGVIGYPGNRTTQSFEKDKNSDWGYSLQGLFRASQNGTLKELRNTECLDKFAQIYQKEYGKLLLVTEDIQENNSYTLIYTNPVYKSNSNNKLSTSGSPDFSSSDYQGAGPYDWICLKGATRSCKSEQPSIMREGRADDSWTVSNWVSEAGDIRPFTTDYKVEYCLAEEMPQHNRLQCSVSLMIVVIAFNIIKMFVLFYMWLGIHDAPILTVGDAIASFLRRSDSYSRGRCLLDNRNVKYMNPSSQVPAEKTHLQTVFTESRRQWRAAVSSRRWAFSIVIWVAAIIVCLALLGVGLAGLEGSDFNVWKQPLGTVSSKTVITVPGGWPNGFLPNVLIANSPQLIFSLLYFAFNSLLTSMCLAAEWISSAIYRKGLRVSGNPTVAQRSNYFLSIPYRYAIPLSTTSSILHWLISRSLFLVSIQAYSADMERNPSGDVYNCVFSPVAIVSGFSVGGAMFLSLIGLSFRRFASAIPVAGSCSLSIAAACHPKYDPNQDGGSMENLMVESEDGDKNMAYLPVQWGATLVDGPIGHCCFTSGDVYPPEEGKEYQ